VRCNAGLECTSYRDGDYRSAAMLFLWHCFEHCFVPYLFAVACAKYSEQVWSDAFEFVGELGVGASSVVYQVLSKHDQQQYALKVSNVGFRSMLERYAMTRRRTLRGKFDRLSTALLLLFSKRAHQEADWYTRLSAQPNEYCVRCHCAWEEDNRLFIQTELLPHGTNFVSL